MENHFVFCHISARFAGRNASTYIRRRTQRKIYSFLTDDAFIVLVSGECLIAQILQSKTKVEKKTQ